MEVGILEVGRRKSLSEDLKRVFLDSGCQEAMFGICDLDERKSDGGGTLSGSFW